MTEWERVGKWVPVPWVSVDMGQRSGEGGVSPCVHFAGGCAYT